MAREGGEGRRCDSRAGRLPQLQGGMGVTFQRAVGAGPTSGGSRFLNRKKQSRCLFVELQRSTTQQAKMEKLQTDTVEDAKVIHDYLGQVHAMITNVIKKTNYEDAGLQADRPDEITSLREAARQGDIRVDETSIESERLSCWETGRPGQSSLRGVSSSAFLWDRIIQAALSRGQ